MLILTVSLCAQRSRIEYFTVTDGLSAREINDIYIGDDGFTWVSTMDGLNRFDGQKFRSFEERSVGKTGLSRGAIGAVRADNEGKFIVTFQEFYGFFDRFDPNDFSVEQVRLAPSTGVAGHPRAIMVDGLGRTYVVSIGVEGTFLYEYTPYATDAAEQFTQIFRDSTDAWTTITPRVELLPLSNGQFLLYDDEHGFRHISAEGELLSRPFENQASLRGFYAFGQAADGRVFLSFRSSIELFTWSPEKMEVMPVSTQNSQLRFPKIYTDRRGQLLLLGTEDILGNQAPVDYYLVDTAGQLSYLESNLPLNRRLSAVAAVDFRETVYLGLREGLGVVEGYRNSVTTWLDKTRAQSAPAHNIVSIVGNGMQTVYFQDKGPDIFRISPQGERLKLDTIFLVDTLADGTAAGYLGEAGMVYDGRRGVLWIAGRPAGQPKGGLLIRHDLRTLNTLTYPLDYRPTAIALGPDARIYLAVSDQTRTGCLLRFDPEGEWTAPLLSGEGSGQEIAGFATNKLYVTKDGRLLIATAKLGLLAYDLKSRKLRNLTNKGALAGARQEGVGKVSALSVSDIESVYAVHEGTDGTLWLGTNSGLVALDTLSGKHRFYSRAEGLSSNLIYGILPDSAGGFWLSSDNGLTHLLGEQQGGGARRYYQQDGLSDDKFLPGSYFKDVAGRYYFGSQNGLSVFREEDLAGSSAGTDVMLTEIDIYGRDRARTLTRNLAQRQQVTVYAREKSIAISFAPPAGQLPGSSRFRYKLEGFNDDWVPLLSERTIRFNNLGSGTYVLRIQGAGANGNYGERERRLTIRVRQFIIEQLWFQVMVVAIFAGLLFYIFQARLREKLVNEQIRTQLSADIHDEVSGLLAGITLQAELLKGRTDDEKLQARLHQVGEAGRSAMSKMSDVIWSIDSRRDTIGNLLQRMQEHADEVLLPLEIRYDFQAAGFEDEHKEIAGNVRQDVYFIYKEAINNIARHSNATRVDIEVEQFAQFFELFIRDNGTPPGESAPAASDKPRTSVRAQKTGQGKDNMRMRANRLKGDLSIDERNGYTLTFRMKRLG